MTEDWREGGFGLYIHWPFCEAKCPYCDFNSHVARHIDQDRWRTAYLAELDRVAKLTSGRVLKSVFFGGGTPSLMAPETVAAILEKAAGCWTFSNDIEVTLEANPSSVEADRFKAYHDAGVNRVSLGVQALNDADLKRLGRLHDVGQARRAMEIARHVFDRASFDLIYARQDQSLTAWEAELRQALDFGFSHMSLYQLTVEDGTAFGERFAAGKLRGLPDEDLAADMYEATESICAEFGLDRYEVSNFARRGEESRHNLIYWRYGDYAGIGPGAHGRLTDAQGRRHATETHLNPQLWLTAAERGSGDTAQIPLSAQDQGSELALMGLRLAEGVSRTRLERVLGRGISEKSLENLIELGAIAQVSDELIVQKQYVSLLNTVVRDLLGD